MGIQMGINVQPGKSTRFGQGRLPLSLTVIRCYNIKVNRPALEDRCPALL
jgi:hypothetical protein